MGVSDTPSLPLERSCTGSPGSTRTSRCRCQRRPSSRSRRPKKLLRSCGSGRSGVVSNYVTCAERSPRWAVYFVVATFGTAEDDLVHPDDLDRQPLSALWTGLFLFSHQRASPDELGILPCARTQGVVVRSFWCCLSMINTLPHSGPRSDHILITCIKYKSSPFPRRSAQGIHDGVRAYIYG